MIPRLILTSGEPAGVGPDVVLKAAMSDWPAALVAVGCQQMLTERAQQLGLHIQFTPYTSGTDVAAHCAGTLPFIHLPLAEACQPGQLNTANAGAVVAQLELATELCVSGECHAMVTAPVQKSVLNDAGIPFSGHTEFLASATGNHHPVMMLASKNLKVALMTTHLPLRSVPDAISRDALAKTLRILHTSLISDFGITQPRITVLGLNPHAGEGGHLGCEEMEVISPVCEALRAEGMAIAGPISADTAFAPERREATDAYLAMFHDQGLPVLKAEGFGEIVNITLGLPIRRTSVDHGTALALAGTGQADASSLRQAIAMTIGMAQTEAAQ